jgi:chromate transporter
MQNTDSKGRYGEVARFFTWLGFIGFGGPQAHIALMQQECQEKRGWLSQEEFNEALAVCNLLPGPASTQLATYIGWFRGGGLVGGLVAAVCFITPAFLLVTLLSWAYFAFGTIPQVNALFYGLKPVVVAIVLATAWRLSQPFRGDWRFWLLLVISAVLIGGRFVNDFLVFFGAALLGLALYRTPKPTANAEKPKLNTFFAPFFLVIPSIITYWSEFFRLFILHPSSLILQITPFANAVNLERLFTLAWFFARAGAVIFGGGLVIIPLIQNEIVEGYGWLTSQQFVDGAAIGQLTPGPVLTTAAFVGYAGAGLTGAFVATFFIFLPGLTFILAAAPILQRVKQFPLAKAMLSGVNGAVVGSLVAGAYFIGQTTFVRSNPFTIDPYTIAIAALSLFLSLKYKTNTIWLFAGGALFGLIASLLPFKLPLAGL